MFSDTNAALNVSYASINKFWDFPPHILVVLSNECSGRDRWNERERDKRTHMLEKILFV